MFFFLVGELLFLDEDNKILWQENHKTSIERYTIEGVSMLYSFNDGAAPERHETQYFEMFGNRRIYHKEWTAVTKHKTPWLLIGEETPAFDDDVWELYDTTKDWTQAKDLSKEMPDKLHELQRLWLIEATRYNVLPTTDYRPALTRCAWNSLTPAADWARAAR